MNCQTVNELPNINVMNKLFLEVDTDKMQMILFIQLLNKLIVVSQQIITYQWEKIAGIASKWKPYLVQLNENISLIFIRMIGH